MNESNLIKRLNWIVTGDKFLASRPIALDAMRVTASGIPVGAATAPTSVVTGVQFDDAETALLIFSIPMDYAEGADVCALRFKVTPTSNNDTTDIGVTTAQNIWRDGQAVDATASSAETEGAQAAATTSREVVLDISGRGYQAGDTVQLTVDVNNAGTAELTVHSIDLIYGSCLAAFNDDDRFRALGTDEV